MNREIKFRFWDINQERMISWNEVQDGVIEGYFKNPGVIPLQYTGLEDKYNKEIYDEDFLLTKHGMALVYWDNDRACFTIQSDIDEIEQLGVFRDNALNNGQPFEILGNKFETSQYLSHVE